MRLVSRMQVSVKTAEVLEALQINIKRHAVIVGEARVGYVVKAKEAVLTKMQELEKGKLSALSFTLRVPQDYTKVYKTAIKMLQLHTDETIELDGDQVRHLMLDEWEWMGDFLACNEGYSGAAREYKLTQGL